MIGFNDLEGLFQLKWFYDSMIFLHDEVSSSHPACQKHLRHLSTNLLRNLPGWCVQKEIGHTGITLYYKVFMPYKAKHIVDRLNG